MLAVRRQRIPHAEVVPQGQQEGPAVRRAAPRRAPRRVCFCNVCCRYEAGRSVKDFVEFVNKETGTLRQHDGKLLATAGRHADLDALASKFMLASESEKAALVAQADSVASGLSSSAPRYAAGLAYYSKVMQNAVKKGAEFPKTELARLTKVVDSGSVAASKMTEFLLRLNVLSAFIPAESS